MHDPQTLQDLRASTKRLGTSLRRFILHTCSHFATKDLPKEKEAKARRRAAAEAKKAANKTASDKKGKGKAKAKDPEPQPGEEYTRTLNIATYKTHALGHHHESCRELGPSDNIDTAVVSILSCLHHTRAQLCTG
jgi:hypothetical protein